MIIFGSFKKDSKEFAFFNGTLHEMNGFAETSKNLARYKAQNN
jgi:hypothetical protein